MAQSRASNATPSVRTRERESITACNNTSVRGWLGCEPTCSKTPTNLARSPHCSLSRSRAQPERTRPTANATHLGLVLYRDAHGLSRRKNRLKLERLAINLGKRARFIGKRLSRWGLGVGPPYAMARRDASSK
eukprot:scaffold80056_cov30-Tisochrysis_lutea.AAC.2